jgi:hypothetical protein
MPVEQVLFSCAGGVLLPEAACGVVAFAVAEFAVAVVLPAVAPADVDGVVVLAVVDEAGLLVPPGALVTAGPGAGVGGGVWAATLPVGLPAEGANTQVPPCSICPGGQVCASAMLGAARAAMIARVRKPLFMEQTPGE